MSYECCLKTYTPHMQEFAALMRERKKQEITSHYENINNTLANWYENSKAKSETHNVEKAQVLWEMDAFRFSSQQPIEKTTLVSQVCFCFSCV